MNLSLHLTTSHLQPPSGLSLKSQQSRIGQTSSQKLKPSNSSNSLKAQYKDFKSGRITPKGNKPFFLSIPGGRVGTNDSTTPTPISNRSNCKNNKSWNMSPILLNSFRSQKDSGMTKFNQMIEALIQDDEPCENQEPSSSKNQPSLDKLKIVTKHDTSHRQAKSTGGTTLPSPLLKQSSFKTSRFQPQNSTAQTEVSINKGYQLERAETCMSELLSEQDTTFPIKMKSFDATSSGSKSFKGLPKSKDDEIAALKLQVRKLNEEKIQDKKTIKVLEEKLKMMEGLYAKATKSGADKLIDSKSKSLSSSPIPKLDQVVANMIDKEEINALRIQNETLMMNLDMLRSENEMLKSSKNYFLQFKEAARRYRDLAQEKSSECITLAEEVINLRKERGLSTVSSTQCNTPTPKSKAKLTGIGKGKSFSDGVENEFREINKLPSPQNSCEKPSNPSQGRLIEDK